MGYTWLREQADMVGPLDPAHCTGTVAPTVSRADRQQPRPRPQREERSGGIPFSIMSISDLFGHKNPANYTSNYLEQLFGVLDPIVAALNQSGPCSPKPFLRSPSCGLSCAARTLNGRGFLSRVFSHHSAAVRALGNKSSVCLYGCRLFIAGPSASTFFKRAVYEPPWEESGAEARLSDTRSSGLAGQLPYASVYGFDEAHPKTVYEPLVAQLYGARPVSSRPFAFSCFRTRITPCYDSRVEAGHCFVPG